MPEMSLTSVQKIFPLACKREVLLYLKSSKEKLCTKAKMKSSVLLIYTLCNNLKEIVLQ